MKNKINLFTVFVINLFVCNSCQIVYDNKEPEKTIICDAENIDESTNKFISKRKLYNIEFGNLPTRTADCSFSGKYSSKTDSIFPYGMSYEIKNICVNDVFSFSVWRKSNDTMGVLAIQGWQNDDSSYYDKTFKEVIEKKDGWEKIGGKFIVPANDKVSKLKIFVFNPTKNVIYFDDLEITNETVD